MCVCMGQVSELSGSSKSSSGGVNRYLTIWLSQNPLKLYPLLSYVTESNVITLYPSNIINTVTNYLTGMKP